MTTPSTHAGTAHHPWYKHLYAQVLVAIALGICSATSIRASASR